MRVVVVGVFVVLAGCRIGFDQVTGDDVARDGVAFDDTAPASCPAGYQSIGVPGSKYKAVDSPSTWQQAQAACVADDTHLLILDDFSERTSVTGLLPTRDLWVGVTDIVTLGTWRTVTGSIATYLPWSTGEPDGTTLERCVDAAFPLYNFSDQDCTVGRRFICECDGRASDPAAY